MTSTRQRAALTAMLLVLSLLVTACGGTSRPAQSAETVVCATTGAYSPDFNVELTKLGDGVKWSGQIVGAKGGKQKLLDPFGNDVLGEQYEKIDRLQTDSALYYLVYDADSEPNPLGLISEDCEVLLPCEAAIIRQLGGAGSRYLEVIHATEPVADTYDAFLYGTLNGENTLYAGYAQYYDLARQQYVPNLRNEDVNEQVCVVGDNLFLRDSGRVYTPDGSVLGEFDGTWTGSCLLGTGSEAGAYGVFDENLDIVANITFWPADVYADGALFAIPVSGGYSVVDADGERVSELLFEAAPEACGPYLCGRDSDGRCALVDHSGHTAVPFSDGVRHARALSHGFVRLEYADGTHALLYPNGDVSCSYAQGGFAFWEYTDSGCQVFVLQDEDYTLRIPNTDWIEPVGSFMIAARDRDTRLYSLYSVMDGRQILGGQYRDIQTSGHYLYAQTRRGWTVFRLEE